MLTAEHALRAYAAMMNTLDASKIEHLLADAFHYASHFVFGEIESKAEYLGYVTEKLKTIQFLGSKVWAEMGTLIHELPGPCVVVAQGEKDELVAVVIATVKEDRISRLDFCMVPTPESAIRSGDYPQDA